MPFGIEMKVICKGEENMCTLDTFIEIKYGSIENAPEDWGVDTIVNAAHPTLRRGTGYCVDAAIHQKIDDINKKYDFLQEEIKKEWREQHQEDESVIKCKRGEIFVTSGCGLCRYIIHTVGPRNDIDSRKPRVCSSSSIDTLKSCYKNVILEALKKSEIKKIAIPVLSAGNYEFDFDVAVKVGVSEVYNTLLEEKKRDIELFGYSTLEKIYFVIDDKENYKVAKRIFKNYQYIFRKEKRIVIFKTHESQAQYLKEIQLYDSQKGHFSVVNFSRKLIVWMRFLSIYTYLKDWVGKEDWERRRKLVEIVVIIKIILPIVSLMLMQNYPDYIWLRNILGGIMLYDLVDTVTYLLELILLADIQNPSANIIRSLLMLLLNYVEAALDIAVIGYVWFESKAEWVTLVAFGLMGIEYNETAITAKGLWLLCLNNGVRFFFLSIALGYFANHLRQRKFRTN